MIDFQFHCQAKTLLYRLFGGKIKQMFEVGEQDDPGELSEEPHQMCLGRSWCLE